MRLLPPLLISALLVACPVSAQTVAEVLKLPLLHDPAAPVVKQSYTAAEKKTVSSVAQTINARAAFRAFQTKNQAQPINSPSQGVMG